MWITVSKSLLQRQQAKESTKEYGSPSGVKSLGTRIEASLSPYPLKAKGKNIIHEDIFPEQRMTLSEDSRQLHQRNEEQRRCKGDVYHHLQKWK